MFILVRTTLVVEIIDPETYAYVYSLSELLSGQVILSGYVPAVLDGHFRSTRRRYWKVENSEITDGEEA